MAVSADEVDHRRRAVLLDGAERHAGEQAPHLFELGVSAGFDGEVAAVVHARRGFVNPDVAVFGDEHFYRVKAGRGEGLHELLRQLLCFVAYFGAEEGGHLHVIDEVQHVVKDHFDDGIGNGTAVAVGGDDDRDFVGNGAEGFDDGGDVPQFVQVFFADDDLYAFAVVAAGACFLHEGQRDAFGVDVGEAAGEVERRGRQAVVGVKLFLQAFVLDEAQHARRGDDALARFFQRFQRFYRDVLDFDANRVGVLGEIQHSLFVAVIALFEQAGERGAGRARVGVEDGDRHGVVRCFLQEHFAQLAAAEYCQFHVHSLVS